MHKISILTSGCLGLMFSLLAAPGAVNPAPPLPTVAEVIERALERAELEAENEQLFNQQYHFVRSRQTEIRNAKGDIKKFKSKISTNSPSGLPEVEEIAEAPLGRPAAHSPKQAALNQSASQPQAPRKFNDEQLAFSKEVVNRYDFKLVGREVINGWSLLVLDFQPRKGRLPEKDLRDRVVNRMAGRLWVDERDYAIKRCHLRLTESLSVVGGIVGEAHKFRYMFDRERTEDGLWYVRESSWQLEGRQVLVKREADYYETRTDVRKLEGLQLRAGINALEN
jgi:hypothetical protein